MITTGIKFTLGGGDTDFNDDEVMDVIVSNSQAAETQENQTVSPVLFTDGDSWKTVIITFIESNPRTLGKINDVIDEEDEPGGCPISDNSI